MRQVRSATNLVMALGLCLLLAVPAAAQVTDYGAAPFPSGISGPLNKGFAFLNKGNYDAAAMEFKKVTEMDSTNPFALNNLAAIEAQKGRYREAMAYLQQATLKANDYKQKVAQTCFVGGLCNAVKPKKGMGPKSTIAPIVQDNIAKLKPKVEALPLQPSSPPPMK